MTPLSDRQIRAEVRKSKMIVPFVDGQIKEDENGVKVISYGLGSYGYDVRIADEFRVFTPNPYNTVIDPKNFDPRILVEFRGAVCVIPPNSFVLARTLEYITMPRNVTGIVLGKSTYARTGLVLNTTPLEAGWDGFITLELSNTTTLPMRVYANEGIGQIVFFRGDDICETSYADRKGKYQHQQGIVLPKV